jgi:hypothetical protein
MIAVKMRLLLPDVLDIILPRQTEPACPYKWRSRGHLNSHSFFAISKHSIVYITHAADENESFNGGSSKQFVCDWWKCGR